ncbi:hypothetical protein D9M71_622400 [compost metagenome]
MTTARGVAVGQLVDQHQLRAGLEQAVKVHFFQQHAAIVAAQQWLLGQTAEQRFGFAAPVRLDHRRQQRHPLAQLGMGGLEHGVGLAHPRCRAQKYLEPAAPFARQSRQQRIGAFGVAIAHCSSLFRNRGEPFEGCVQGQHIDHRRTNQWLQGGLLYQGLQGLCGNLPRRRHARQLIGHGSG